MPKNYFINREQRGMDSNIVKCNQLVFIVEKHMQGCKSIDELQLGLIRLRLSNGGVYKNGCKVKIAPLSPTTRKMIKPYIDEYYKKAILNFNNPNFDFKPHINKLNAAIKNLGLDLMKECNEYEGELIVGRIQYFLYPENYKPDPILTILKLGLSNNKICDINSLQEQLNYIKSNYYINCNNYLENTNKLIKFRTLINTFDINTLRQMGIFPNYCEIFIEDNKYIKDTKYYEVK